MPTPPTNPLTEVKTALGRSFVVVGAAPATVMMTLLYWYETKPPGSFFKAFKFDGGADLGGLALLSIVAAVGLFLGAQGLLDWLRRAPVSSVRLDRYAQSRADLNTEEERLDALLTLIKWGRNGFKPQTDDNKKKLYDETLFGTPPIYAPGWTSVEERLRALQWWSSKHDADYDYQPELKAAVPRRLPEDFDGMEAHVEQSRDALARRLAEMPVSSRRFRIGRLSARMDDYGLRYGMATPTMLSRLLLVLDEKVREGINDARANVEALLAFMLAALLVVIVIMVQSAYLRFSGPTACDGAAFALLGACLLAAFLCWKTAPTMFLRYASHVVATIDTSQGLLFDKLGLEKQSEPHVARSVLQHAAAFFADEETERWRPEWKQRLAQLQISLPKDRFVADGMSSIGVAVSLTHAGSPFSQREVVLRANRGAFVTNGQQSITLQLSGAREANSNRWSARSQTFYAAPTDSAPVQIVASCGGLSSAATLKFVTPPANALDVWVESVTQQTGLQGFQVALRARIGSKAYPAARFVGVSPRFTSTRGFCWRTSAAGDDGIAHSVWFVPASALGPIIFSASYGNIRKSVTAFVNPK
jgi:hypothetical protein